MFWAVLETVIVPALNPIPLPGVARSVSVHPLGAALPTAQAAVILRVTLTATVEEYWAYVFEFVALEGTAPGVAGLAIVRDTAEDVIPRRQKDESPTETAEVTVVALRLCPASIARPRATARTTDRLSDRTMSPSGPIVLSFCFTRRPSGSR